MKDQPEDKFEQRIRERLQSLESDPPTEAWDRLAGDLPTASPLGYRRWVALVVLLGMMIGGAAWWTLVDQSTTQKKAALKSITGQLPTDGPLTSEAKPSVEVVEPNDLKRPAEAPAKQSAAQSRRSKQEELTNRNQNTTIRIFSNPKLQTQSSFSQNRQASAASRSSSGLITPELATDPKEVTQRTAKNADGQTPVPLVAPSQPVIEAGLPKVAIVFPSSNLVSEPSPPSELGPIPSRWELWVTANPMLLYQRVAPDASDAVQVTSLNRTTFSRDRLGFQASAGGLYQLTPRLALKFGVYYRYTRDQWTYDYHNNVTDSFDIVRIDENTVEATPVYEEQRGTISETSHRVGALAGVLYRLSGQRFGNILSAELQAQSLTEQPAWYAHVSYVAERKLGRRWSVHAGPSFLWNFSGPGSRSEHFVLKPYGFGVQAGVSYQLQLRR